MPNAQRVTIFLRQAQSAPGYNDLLTFLNSNGARDVFGHQALDTYGDPTGAGPIRGGWGGVVYWIDTPGRVERLLPQIRDQYSDAIAVVEDIRLAFDTTTGLPDLSPVVLVADVMTREVQFVEPEVAVSELIYLMVRRDLRAVPVVDADMRVVGIVTNSDLVSRAGLGARLELLRGLASDARQSAVEKLDASGNQVRDIMTHAVVSIETETSVQDAARLMIQRRLKRLPVVDGEGALVGIVSRVDLLRSISTFQEGPEEVPDHVERARAETPVREVMSQLVPEVHVDAPLAEVLAAVVSTRLNRAIVVDDERHVVGIVSDADLVERLTPQARPGAISVMMHRVPGVHTRAEFEETLRHTRGHTARDLMREVGAILNANDRVGNVIGIVLETESKAVPVVDDAGRLAGVIDRGHLLWAVLDRGAAS